MSNKEALHQLVELVDKGDKDYKLEVVDAITNEPGVLNILSDRTKVKIYTGNGDGSDDYEMSVSDFLEDQTLIPVRITDDFDNVIVEFETEN